MQSPEPSHQYFEKIKQFSSQLSSSVKTALDEITHLRHFKKGEYLLREGEVCRNNHWIKHGAVRKYYITKEKEISTELLFENDLVVSLSSYALQIGSNEFIQALEDTTVSCTSYQDFEKLKQRHPELVQLDLLITESYALWLEERLQRFHTLDAAAHYQLLLQEHPEMIQKVKLTHIASYLGISLETLSRIRSRM